MSTIIGRPIGIGGGENGACTSHSYSPSYAHSPGLAKAAGRVGAKVRWGARKDLDQVSSGGAHQGLAAKVIEKASHGVDDFLAGLSEEQKAGTVLVALDQIQDPQNFGAIARSAVCLGARALLITERRSAPLSQAVLQASAGAVQKIPVIRVVNLSETLTRLKEAGFWIYGADPSGRPVWKVRFNFPLVLVVGSEGGGIRRLVASNCDERVAIPQAGAGVASLNASCAAGILLYEAARQRAQARHA